MKTQTNPLTAQQLAERAADKLPQMSDYITHRSGKWLTNDQLKALLKCAKELDKCIDCLERTCPPKGGSQVIKRAQHHVEGV